MNAAILGQVGFVIAVPIAFGAWLGLKLDERLNTSPWGLLTLTLVGMVVAGVSIARLIQRYAEENPVRPSSERARAAGREWDAEIRARERKREMGEDEDR